MATAAVMIVMYSDNPTLRLYLTLFVHQSVLLGSGSAGGLKLSAHPRLFRTPRFRCRSPQTCRHCLSRRSGGVCHARKSHLRAEQTPLCCSAAAALAYSFSRFGPSVA